MGADLIEGKKGSGKSKLAVMWMRDALLEGRMVATNLDLKLEKLLPPMSKATAIRLPDKPTAADLDACGVGNKENRYDPDRDGLMVLDELATWMNARSYSDAGRAAVLEFLVHSRKRNWGTVLICQNLIQIDKQAREAHVDYVTRCQALERVRWPMVGWIIQSLAGRKAGYLPRGHRAIRRMGADPKGLVAETWLYRTGDVQDGYDTLQEFSHNYPHGVYSMLSAWHLVGRHLPAPVPWWRRLFGGARLRRPGALRPKLPAVALAAELPRDEAWRWASRYVRGLA